MNHVRPAVSRMVKPGVMPSLLPETTVHLPGAGPLVVSGPRRTSSTVSGRAPARLVNQLESGTSSMVLMLTALSEMRSPGLMNVFSTKSYVSLRSHARTWAASSVSGSTVMGSSGK